MTGTRRPTGIPPPSPNRENDSDEGEDSEEDEDLDEEGSDGGGSAASGATTPLTREIRSYEETQCAPGSFNLNQKVHGLYHFYKTVIYKTIQNQLKKPSVIGLPKQ